jgi:hypothetical protein
MFPRAATCIAAAALLLPAYLPASPGNNGGSGNSCKPAPTYSGEAFGASVNVLGVVKATVSDTGPLPSNGGSLSTDVANIDLPGVLTLALLTESTNGANLRANSQSSVANLSLTVAGLAITASVLTSNATAQACGTSNPSTAGASTIAALTVNGFPITVTGAPNQTIPLLVGALIINEQISSVSSAACSASAHMTVNALHLTVAGVADVVISSSRAGVSCNPPPQ